MLLRSLTPEDAAVFLTLRLRGLQECPEAFASSYEEEATTPPAEIEKRLKPKTDSAIVGAFRNGELVGLTDIQRENMPKLAHKAFIWGVYVAPQARGHGVGTRVVSHALNYASETLGVRQVNLGVNAGNTAAVELYKKMGFVQYGFEQGFLLVAGVLHDEYQMVWHGRGAA
jgi:ribosomal protein S18 acetylase RimI-like enzyme